MFDWLKTGKTTQPRKEMPSPELDEAEFKRRFLSQFEDPCFEPLAAELVRVSSTAWCTTVQDEVRFAARLLVEAVNAKRAGKLISAPEMAEPRQK